MSATATPAEVSPCRFQHEALLYAGLDDFLVRTAPFVREGVAVGEPVLVAVPPARLEALKEELNSDAGGVEFVDMVHLGTNPARIIPAWRDFLDRNGGGRRPVRGSASRSGPAAARTSWWRASVTSRS